MVDSNQGETRDADKGAAASSRKSNRGFASMDKERQRAIASEGGRAAHRSGNAHEFTSEEARRAGQQSHAGRRQGAQAAPSTGEVARDEER